MPNELLRRAAASAAPISLRLEKHAGADALLLSGELDMDTVPLIDRFLRRRLGPFFHRRNLVLDLAGVTLVDSSFVTYVIRLSEAVHRAGFELLLTRPVGHVRRAIRVVGLANVLPVYESLEEAVALAAAGRVPMIPPPFASPS